jgi:hypothetical protein
MASGLFDNGRNLFAKGLIHWNTTLNSGDTIKCALMNTAVYTADLAADIFYDDAVNSAEAVDGLIGTAATLTLAEPVAGVCDAADVTYTAVTGAATAGLVLYKWVTADGDSPLIAWVEFTSVTPNGGDITIQWAAPNSNGIFKL